MSGLDAKVGLGVPAGPDYPLVEDYLAEVVTRLPGPARGHAGIVAELRSGLLDASDAYRGAGMDPDRACQTAIGEFGDPIRVAASFRAEIAAAQARRVVLALLATGPAVGLLWITTAMASHLGVDLAMPWHEASSPALDVGLFLVAAAVAVTTWAALVGLGSTGRLTRWLSERPRRPPTAAAIAGFGAIGADGLGLTMLVVQLSIAPGKLAPVPAAIAAVASATRLLLARRAARQCLSLRAALA